MKLEELLSKLDKVKQINSTHWMACCPVHSEKTPSLGITLNDDKLLLHCFGCQAGAAEIVEALGMSIEDLFPERVDVDYKSGKKRVYFNTGLVLKCLEHEITVISLAAHDCINNGSFNKNDLARVELARSRINDAMTYCFKN